MRGHSAVSASDSICDHLAELKKNPFFFTKSAMVRSEAQPGSSRAGNKRPKDKSSEGTSPDPRPSSHKKPATQREQVEGDPKRLELSAENQQGVLLLAESPARDKQPESQPASEVDAISVAGSRSDHGEAAPAKTHEENTGYKASSAAPLH